MTSYGILATSCVAASWCLLLTLGLQAASPFGPGAGFGDPLPTPASTAAGRPVSSAGDMASEVTKHSIPIRVDTCIDLSSIRCVSRATIRTSRRNPEMRTIARNHLCVSRSFSALVACLVCDADA